MLSMVEVVALVQISWLLTCAIDKVVSRDVVVRSWRTSLLICAQVIYCLNGMRLYQYACVGVCKWHSVIPIFKSHESSPIRVSVRRAERRVIRAVRRVQLRIGIRPEQLQLCAKMSLYYLTECASASLFVGSE